MTDQSFNLSVNVGVDKARADLKALELAAIAADKALQDLQKHAIQLANQSIGGIKAGGQSVSAQAQGGIFQNYGAVQNFAQGSGLAPHEFAAQFNQLATTMVAEQNRRTLMGNAVQLYGKSPQYNPNQSTTQQLNQFRQWLGVAGAAGTPANGTQRLTSIYGGQGSTTSQSGPLSTAALINSLTKLTGALLSNTQAVNSTATVATQQQAGFTPPPTPAAQVAATQLLTGTGITHSTYSTSPLPLQISQWGRVSVNRAAQGGPATAPQTGPANTWITGQGRQWQPMQPGQAIGQGGAGYTSWGTGGLGAPGAGAGAATPPPPPLPPPPPTGGPAPSGATTGPQGGGNVIGGGNLTWMGQLMHVLQGAGTFGGYAGGVTGVASSIGRGNMLGAAVKGIGMLTEIDPLLGGIAAVAGAGVMGGMALSDQQAETQTGESGLAFSLGRGGANTIGQNTEQQWREYLGPLTQGQAFNIDNATAQKTAIQLGLAGVGRPDINSALANTFSLSRSTGGVVSTTQAADLTSQLMVQGEMSHQQVARVFQDITNGANMAHLSAGRMVESFKSFEDATNGARISVAGLTAVQKLVGTQTDVGKVLAPTMAATGADAMRSAALLGMSPDAFLHAQLTGNVAQIWDKLGTQVRKIDRTGGTKAQSVYQAEAWLKGTGIANLDNLAPKQALEVEQALSRGDTTTAERLAGVIGKRTAAQALPEHEYHRRTAQATEGQASAQERAAIIAKNQWIQFAHESRTATDKLPKMPSTDQAGKWLKEGPEKWGEEAGRWLRQQVDAFFKAGMKGINPEKWGEEIGKLARAALSRAVSAAWAIVAKEFGADITTLGQDWKKFTDSIGDGFKKAEATIGSAIKNVNDFAKAVDSAVNDLNNKIVGFFQKVLNFFGLGGSSNDNAKTGMHAGTSWGGNNATTSWGTTTASQVHLRKGAEINNLKGSPIPLTKEVLADYVNASKRFNVPLSVLLAQGAQESAFGTRVDPKNPLGGMGQFSSDTVALIKSQSGIKNFDPMNKASAAMGQAWYDQYLRKHDPNKHLSAADQWGQATNAYNSGSYTAAYGYGHDMEQSAAAIHVVELKGKMVIENQEGKVVGTVDVTPQKIPLHSKHSGHAAGGKTAARTRQTPYDKYHRIK